MRMPKELHSDEEFEQWVTVFAEWNTYSYSDGHKPTEDERMFEKMVTAKYERTLWYHRKRFNRWIDTCISLLKHIKDDGLHISRQQIERMNIQNTGNIVPCSLVDSYEEASMTDEEESGLPDKIYYGKKIYVRKMERLYYRIRLYKLREWWE